MQFNPDVTYNHLIFNGERDMAVRHRVAWTIEGPLSGDLMAGLVLGLSIIYDDMVTNYHYPITEGNFISGATMDNKFFTILIGNIRQRLRRYIDDIVENPYVIEFTGTYDKFWWFILNPKAGTYFVVDFGTPEFIQGFISITQAFGVDFRNYVHGLPFKVRDGQKEFYQIQGYHIVDVMEVD